MRRTITVHNIMLQFDTDGEGTPLQEVETLLAGINGAHAKLDECPFFSLPPQDEEPQIEALKHCDDCGNPTEEEDGVGSPFGSWLCRDCFNVWAGIDL